ncbi:MAG: hypothetical protein R3F44_01365 [Candidatus Competibacteraceae bacterium]
MTRSTSPDVKGGADHSQHEFMGYGRQKQMVAWRRPPSDWVPLLDADEALSLALRIEIDQLLDTGPCRDGYEMPGRNNCSGGCTIRRPG